MKRILHYVKEMNRGGLETVIMNIYKNIDRSKYQFDFAVHSAEQADFNDEIEKMGGRLILFPEYRKNPIKYRRTWNIFWKKNKHRYHAFHYHASSLANIESIKAAKSNGFHNIIVHSHSTYSNRGKLQKIHDLLHLKNQKYIINNHVIKIAVSSEAAVWLYGQKSLDSGNIQIINNGIDYSDFKFNEKKRAKAKERLGITNEFIIGHVGNFYPVKNHQFLILLFTKILEEEPNSRLLLLGEGGEIAKIKEYTEQLSIDDKVLFLGNVSNVNDYLNIMDVFVFPSLYEGLGLAPIEAQINGLPVVYSNSVPDAIEISDTISSLDLNDNIGSWVEIVMKMSFKRNENLELNQKFDINTSVIKMENIYDSLA